MPPATNLPVAGWRERVDLPEWGLKRVRAKLDTGARTSAIDVATIEHLPNGNIRFEVVGRHEPVRKTRWVEATPVRISVVKPSSGEAQERIVCRTLARIGPVEREIEISLVCRRGMLCRMLLGRTALDGALLVDSSCKYRLTKKSKKTNKPAAGTGDGTQCGTGDGTGETP